MGVKKSFLGRLLASSDTFSDEQVTQTINLLVEHGVTHRATDIHIEPHERFALVRYRIDGTLRSAHKLPTGALATVVRQIKELAHLHTAEDHLPQEGQYATLVGEEQFEIQVATLPVVGGEKIVLHITRRLTKPLSLESLGFWGRSLQLLYDGLSHSHGLILVATPRRSGKTTTLHSMLQVLNVPSVSIATVESAIEYRLPGASQTQVRPQRGITFHDGLRAALNQDPNVVMISSLTDAPTTTLAIQAGVGGHLVIAGVHGDSAATALTHVRALTEEPYLLANSVRIAVSQRLVRKLCPNCRKRYIPAQEQIAEIEKTFGMTTPAARRKVHELEQQAAGAGIDTNKHVNTTPSHIISLWQASDEGCEHCHYTGYQGSIAIIEVMNVTENVQKAMLEHLTAGKIHTAALKDGFIPMGLDGLVKALRGQTTITEVLRNTTV